MNDTLARLYCQENRRIFSTLVRLLGSFDLAEEARIALTLREVCGLTTEAIASAFLLSAPTLAQRIVRAKAKITAAHIP